MFRSTQGPSSGSSLVFSWNYLYGFMCMISAGVRPQAAHLLKSWVRIPPGAWIFVCCECRVLSGRGLCDELITRPEESYRLCCVVVCDLETSRTGAPYIYDTSSLRINHSADQEIPHPSWNTKLYYNVHKNPSLLPLLSQMHPIHTLTFISSVLVLSSYLHLQLPRDLNFMFSNKTCMHFSSLPCVLHATPMSFSSI